MRLKKDVNEYLIALRDKYNGKLTARIVVENAMDPDSPIHGEFNWDKDKAAWAHWEHKARQMINKIEVNIITDKKVVTCVAMVRDPSVPRNEQGYISIEKIRSNEDMAREVLVDEFKRVAAALQRAQRLAIVFGLESEVDAMARQASKLRKHVEEYTLPS